jgi:hypothetical protein
MQAKCDDPSGICTLSAMDNPVELAFNIFRKTQLAYPDRAVWFFTFYTASLHRNFFVLDADKLLTFAA